MSSKHVHIYLKPKVKDAPKFDPEFIKKYNGLSRHITGAMSSLRLADDFNLKAARQQDPSQVPKAIASVKDAIRYLESYLREA